MNYPFNSIQINKREVSLKDIHQGHASPLTEFELATFNFIRSWLSDGNEFSTQTSGSTGKPKTITVHREQMKRSALRTIQALALSPSDNLLLCLSTQFIAGKMMLVRALEGNMKIIAVEPSSSPLELIQDDQPIDFMAVVPLQLQALISSNAYLAKMNAMKAIIVGGASINEKLNEQLQSISCPVYATYGMTETISHVALQLLNTKNKSSHFQVINGVQISTDDRNCLIIKDEILSETIVTNDQVEIQESGKFKWLGRIDNIINSGGVKINPESVEKKVERIASQAGILNNMFITGLPHEILGQQVTLIIEGQPLSKQSEILLLSKLASEITEYEVPKIIKYIPHFTYTETGKINRRNSLQSGVID